MQISRVLHAVRGLALAIICSTLLPSAARAQEADGFASPFLPTDHWSYDALRRVAALGVLEPGFDRGTRSLSRREALRMLEAAVERSIEERPEVSALVVAYRDRLAEEFPATVEAFQPFGGRTLRVAESALEADYRYHEGEVRTGRRSGANWSGPTPLPTLEDEGFALTLGLELRPALAGVLVPSWTGQEWQFREAYGVVGWRSLGFWAGRRAPGFRPGVGGGIVLDGAVTIDGGGLFFADPVVLPGFLRHLGPVRFDLFLARLESNGRFEHPWFWGARGTVEPHPRLSLGVSRAAMFGGEGNTEVSLRDVLYVLVGKHAGEGSELDNQIVSVDVSYRPPVGALPLVAYIEWGFEDSAGAWYEAPGIVAGAEIAAVPGLPQVAFGVEYTAFVPWDRNSGIWYQHGGFRDGWTHAGVPLGHPLGGHGSEWLAHARADALNARLHIAARAYARERDEGNLFAPDREGRSTGGSVSARFRIVRGVEVLTHGEIEEGRSGWRRNVGYLGLRAFL